MSIGYTFYETVGKIIMADMFEEPKSERPDFERYFDIVRRRHLHFLIPLLLGWMIVWSASWILPARYKSTDADPGGRADNA